jgi:hypothetical protein
MKPTARRKTIICSIAVILCIPIIGAMVSQEVEWSLFDFLIALFLLSAFGLAIELIFQRLTAIRWRRFALAILLLLMVLIWGELAVGIIGSPCAGD